MLYIIQTIRFVWCLLFKEINEFLFWDLFTLFVCSFSSNELSKCPVDTQLSWNFQAVSLLRPGGLLVYSTCTTLRAENEDIVLWALDTFPGLLSLSPQEPCLRPHYIEGFQVPVQKFGPPIASSSGEFPEDEDTIGFFIAKFQKSVEPVSHVSGWDNEALVVILHVIFLKFSTCYFACSSIREAVQWIPMVRKWVNFFVFIL